jgi:5-formyltetrahydrofolate cyclo-ligase
MTKDELRKRLRARRRAFVAALAAKGRLEPALVELTERIVAQLGEARSVAAYWPAGAEVDTRAILAAAAAQGRATALPHIESPGSPLRFLRWRPGDRLETGAHALLQPRADAGEIIPDLILTPLLGFDRRLMRLGQGAGYYDRLFARLPAVRRIGLAWSAQEVEEAPADPWDIALHGVATEREWIGAETP